MNDIEVVLSSSVNRVQGTFRTSESGCGNFITRKLDRAVALRQRVRFVRIQFLTVKIEFRTDRVVEWVKIDLPPWDAPRMHTMLGMLFATDRYEALFAAYDDQERAIASQIFDKFANSLDGLMEEIFLAGEEKLVLN